MGLFEDIFGGPWVILRYFLDLFFLQYLDISGGCNFVGKLNSQKYEGPRCFGPHHLTLRGSMGDFKVFFGPFFQIQAFRPVLANYE